MADLPVELPARAAERLARALDVEGKIPRALEALGPIGGRDVALVDVPDGIQTRRLAELGARVRPVPWIVPFRMPLSDVSVDAVLGFWSAFRGVDEATLHEVDRVLRPGGRLLVVHDYGRDDISRMRPKDLPEYVSWGRRDGPFLRGGFRIRVLHCFWTFDDLDETRSFLADAFDAAGSALGETLKRPRLSWNVAVYHRGRFGAVGPAAEADGAADPLDATQPAIASPAAAPSAAPPSSTLA